MPSHIFAETRRTSAWVIVASLVVLVGGAVLLFNSEVYRQDIITPIHKATRGLCNGTLIHGVIVIALSVGVIIVGLGRLRLRDVGLRREHIFPAVVTTSILWLTIQGIAVVTALAKDGNLVAHSLWDTKGVATVLGQLLGQLFGNALCEEIIFRGLLIAQLYLVLARPLRDRPKWRLAAAVLLSQLVFAAIHVPNRLALGAYDDVLAVLADQSMLVFMGILFSWLYLRTHNLLIAVGIHAIVNSPTMLFASPLDREGWTQGLVVALAIAMVLAWSRIEKNHVKHKVEDID